MALYNSDYDLLGKILLIGESGVGKSSLLLRYTEDVYTGLFIATIGVDFKIHKVTVGDKTVKLQIWDTAGQERFRSITNSYYRGAHGVLLCYDITDDQSFEGLSQWLKDLKKSISESTPIILVGLKSDLKEKRAVSEQQAQNFAEVNGLKYIECSAKTHQNVDSVFYQISAQILDARSSKVLPVADINKDKLLKPSNSVETQDGIFCKCTLL
eukprot:TRINITY_DN1005_c0_g1_i1.p1 TRINITY_DN1005_c0_g1~~TRINITY_DN1005_c0_g1_i1.p1  ORF type:complete len:212 (+),score=31.16 TRINITY_DN1005_c0_g1_i1:34-669(+)